MNFDTGPHYVALAGLELKASACFCFLSTGVKGMFHLAVLIVHFCVFVERENE